MSLIEKQSSGDKTIAGTTSPSEIEGLKQEFQQFSSYSLEEKKAGTWMGKQRYSKTIYIPSLPNATSQSYPHNIANVDSIWIDTSNTFMDYKDGSTYPIPNVHMTTIGYQMTVSANRTSVTINSGTSNRSSASAYVSVFYTKN